MRRICLIGQIQPGKYVLDRADYIDPIRQHELGHTRSGDGSKGARRGEDRIDLGPASRKGLEYFTLGRRRRLGLLLPLKLLLSSTFDASATRTYQLRLIPRLYWDRPPVPAPGKAPPLSVSPLPPTLRLFRSPIEPFSPRPPPRLICDHTTTAKHEIEYISPIEYTPTPPKEMRLYHGVYYHTFCPSRAKSSKHFMLLLLPVVSADAETRTEERK